MTVGIDASRAFLKRRTGIEEYSYQVIRHLRSVIPEGDHVVLYVRRKFAIRNSRFVMLSQEIDFDLPPNWEVRAIWAPRFWTQVGLSIEMLFRAPDVLFVPAHIVPVISPKRTIVTVHGLEYEMFPEAYSLWERLYMRFSIRFSVRAASRVIAVSENTKQDLMKLYRVPEEKISVIYEGKPSHDVRVTSHVRNTEYGIPNTKYFLFIGRLEERKNISRIIEAFGILKETYKIPHALVLAGKPGFGYGRIKNEIRETRYGIREMGYVSDEEKRSLLAMADVFLFPTIYEGFGLPVIEAQAAGIPVVTSNTSSLPEIAGDGAVFVDPLSAESIAAGIWSLVSDDGKRSAIIQKGLGNARRFSWQACAEEVAVLLRD